MEKPFRIEERGSAAWLWLARPERRNALGEALIAGLTGAIEELSARADIRMIVLAGEGPSFCAGADLDGMRRAVTQGEADNLRDAQAMAGLMAKLAALPKPTIARVQGAAYGGGVGLVACCDIAIAADDAKFSLSEVRLGLIPAVISPYVVEAIGLRQARFYTLTAEVFGAQEALALGLVHRVVAASELDAAVDDMLALLAKGGPQAQSASKILLREVACHPHGAELRDLTAARIASVRAGAEAQEGIAAFLGKRKPRWAEE
jgi:methylglutaconyl-CoA hydratase